MMNFLKLPREIRNEVLSILLYDALHTPTPYYLKVQEVNTKRDPNDASARKIRYPLLPPPQSPLNALFCVNQQLYHECHDAIMHYQQAGMPSIIDLLIEDSRWLFPTVVQVLSYTPVLKTVRIQIRPYLSVGSSALSSFAATWRIGDFLNAFLKHGPAFDFSKKAKSFIIEDLVLDLVTDQSLEDHARSTSSMQLVDHVKTLRDFMEKQMDGFLTVRDKKYYIPWGPILLSRVRRFKVMDAGKLVVEIDLVERARECRMELVEPPQVRYLENFSQLG
jgi:hypothetical protein